MILFPKAMDMKDTGLLSFDFLLTDFSCSLLRTDQTMTKMRMEILPRAFQVWGQFCFAPAGVVGKLSELKVPAPQSIR